MKQLRYLIFALLAIFTFTGCRVGRTSSTSGMPQESYLAFWSNGKRNIEVSLDNSIFFNAQTKKESVHNVKGKLYAIPAGKHELEIKENGRVIYKKYIFLSAQETQNIQIP